ncbi:unnamed protein product, partial [Brenthis ino]
MSLSYCLTKEMGDFNFGVNERNANTFHRTNYDVIESSISKRAKMEENSDLHMETDVSSTTGDVPDSQQGSEKLPDVEMVVVVQVKEEDSDNKNSSEIKPKDSDKAALCTESNLSPLKDVVSENVVTSLSKDNLVPNVKEKSPTKSDQEKIQASPKNPPIISVDLHNSEETIDSSNHVKNENNEKQEEHTCSVSTETPVTSICVSPVAKQTESTQKSPIKEQSVEKAKTPTKEIIQKSNIESKEDKKEERTINNLVDMCEKSNDSQTNSDISEKEHNKSISRELKSLIKSAKESKIISECTQLTTKTRKSRITLDNSNTSLNTSVEVEKIQGVRRSSTGSQKSNCSEKAEKVPIKRSMRSQNPEFVYKVKQFLNSVTGKFQKGETDDEGTEDKKDVQCGSMSPSPKKKKQEVPLPEMSPGRSNKLRSDPYCWRCHWQVEQTANDKGHPPMQCTVCPRSFHFKCMSGTERNKINTEKNWVCPECLSVLHAESSETRSPAMKKITLGHLCELLQYALERMKDLNGVDPFLQPVDRAAFPDYDKYVVHPMDLSLMKNNITEGLYGSTEAFLADAQWILHNSIIFNTLQSKLTGGARALVRSCRAEMGEIEACPECYAAAHARRPTWFTDVCSTPHILMWAKLKGFPYWPAKGMSVSSAGLVDVRFFGAHDRAWVPARDCFLYCEKDPNNFRTKRQDILDSMQEAEQHIRNISRKYGKFVYPPFKTQFDPTKLTEQVKMMIPTFEGELRTPIKDKPNSSPHGSAKEKSRSNSKSSKSSVNDGDISENEESQMTPLRKMADGAEIAREEEDFAIEKDKPIEIEVPSKEKEMCRKRRRSELEEAVLTVIETSFCEKRPKIDENDKSSATKKSEDIKDKSLVDIVIDVDKPIAAVNNKIVDMDITVLPNEKTKEITNNTEIEPVIDKTPVKINLKIKPTRSSTPKDDKKDEKPNLTPKLKPVRSEKSTPIEKDKQEDKKAQKRRNSRNKSLNSSVSSKEKTTEKKNDNANTNGKEKKENGPNKANEKAVKVDQKSIKDRIQFDDDISLAVIAKQSKTSTVLPTISSVRSLSTTPQNADAPNKNTEIIIANSDSSIFTPTSTDNVRNMKEAVNKLQKLRSDTETPVGRVGVRAFARMTSPDRPKPTEDVEIEIKSEPIDFDDADRQSEKMDLMNAFHLRPVNPPASNLRGVRINKVVVAPIARKTPTKPAEIRVKAKKTFPQPRKPDDGRSELNSKNSMVYIPIQPPSTQAPVRPTRPITVNGSANSQTTRPQVSSSTSCIASTILNTTIPPVPITTMTNTISTPTVVSNCINNPICVPTVGQVPTTVQTVPFITSVNGQWTFSLQPIMSVGGIDGSPSSPVVNGLTERNNNAMVPIVTPAVVSAPILNALQPAQIQTTNNTIENPPGPPRLQQRPLLNPLDSNTPIGSVPPPSSAGPLTAKLNQNAVKLADFFRLLLEDSLDKIEEPASHVTALKLQMEQMQWRHQQEINELKHNHDLLITEMRASLEKATARAVSEARRNAQMELEAAVKTAKAKQWCANCSQEAQFYCCWNTSYCDYPCQKAHWSQHSNVCAQQRNQDNNGNDNGSALEKRLQPAPETLPKSTSSTPVLTVGGKIAPTRTFGQDSPQKASIIVSMVEDQSGNQTVKCVGTYKPTASQQGPPLLINKQIMNNEENAAKKVVTSGGYLIVGAGSGNQPLVAPSRRQHTLQYYT